MSSVGAVSLNSQQRQALEAVAAGQCWRRKGGAWGKYPASAAHPITLIWLLREGLIRLVPAPHGQPWDECRLTIEGREVLQP